MCVHELISLQFAKCYKNGPCVIGRSISTHARLKFVTSWYMKQNKIWFQPGNGSTQRIYKRQKEIYLSHKETSFKGS